MHERLLVSRYVVLLPLLVAALLAPMNRLRPMAHLTYADLALILAVLAVLARQFAARRTLVLPLGFILPPAVVLLGGLLQTFVLDSGAGLLYLTHYVVAAALVPLVVFWSVAGDRRAQIAVAAAWVCGTVFSSLVGIFSHHGMSLLGFSDPWAFWRWGGYRIAGLAFHPNILAMSVATALSFLVVAGILVRRPALRVAVAGMVIVLFYALDLTGSRAALAAVLLVLPFLLWVALGLVDARRRATTFVAGGVALLLVMVVLNLTGQYDSVSAFDRLFGGADTGFSDRERRMIRDQAFADFFAHPLLGAGYVHIRDAHNFFLQFLQSGGVIGLAGFLAYIGLLAVLGRRSWRDSEHLYDRLLAAGLMAAIGVWLLVGLFQNAVVERSIYLPVGLLLALAYSRAPAPRAGSE